MKYNQKKKKENIEIFLFIMVMAVFAAVLGVMSLGEKMQPVNQIRKISSGWYYYDNGKRTEVTLPDTIQAEKGEELILYNDGITDLDAGKVVTTRGAQYDLKIWLGDRPIYEYQDTTFVRNTQMKSKLECVGEIPTDMQNEPLKLVYSNPHHGKYVLTSVYIGTGYRYCFVFSCFERYFSVDYSLSEIPSDAGCQISRCSIVPYDMCSLADYRFFCDPDL